MGKMCIRDRDIDGTYQICQAESAIQIRHIMSMSCGLPYGHMTDDTPTGKEICNTYQYFVFLY